MAVVVTQIGLSMNNAKTKYMVNRKDNNEPKEIEIMGKNLKMSNLLNVLVHW
jgi:hypothetical protein